MSIEAMNWAMHQEVGSSTRKLVLMLIANHVGQHRDGQNIGFPSVRLLAKRGELGERTVRREIQELEKMGKFKVSYSYNEAGRQIPSDYIFPDDLQVTKAPPTLPHRQGEGATQAGGEGATLAPLKPSEKNHHYNPLPSVGDTRTRNAKNLPRTPIDPNWKPDATDCSHADTRGLTASLTDISERFFNYHTQNGSLMADWHAAWRTWCSNELKRPQRQPSPGLFASPAPAVDLMETVKAYVAQQPKPPPEADLNSSMHHWLPEAFTDLLDIAGIERPTRADLDTLNGWASSGFEMGESVPRVVTEVSQSSGQRAYSMRFFDRAVRSRALKWDEAGVQWREPSAFARG